MLCRSWRLACGALSVNKITLENGLAVTRAVLGAKTYQRRFIAANRLLALGPPQSLAVKLECLEPAAARRAHATITGRCGSNRVPWGQSASVDGKLGPAFQVSSSPSFRQHAQWDRITSAQPLRRPL